MGKAIEMVGSVYGRLTVISREQNNNDGKPQFLCKCECGNTCVTAGKSLRLGHTRSCGCMHRESLERRAKDLTGMRFGMWTVIAREGSTSAGKALFRCRCDCGSFAFVPTGNLISGVSKSCGCFSREQTIERNHKRASECFRETPALYRVWYGMNRRCYEPKTAGYKNYGGRGISVCDEWKSDVDAFHSWAKSNGYAPGLTIDRIYNNGNYSPENCRWTDRLTQANNTRRNRIVDLDGEKKTISQWSRKKGITPSVFRRRYKIK